MGLFRMKTTIDVASLIECVACLHYPWDSQRNTERLPDSMTPYWDHIASAVVYVMIQALA